MRYNISESDEIYHWVPRHEVERHDTEEGSYCECEPEVVHSAFDALEDQAPRQSLDVIHHAFRPTNTQLALIGLASILLGFVATLAGIHYPEIMAGVVASLIIGVLMYVMMRTAFGDVDE